ncbi:MAG: PorV/PorQ family protein [Candidatus Eisenbacteria bacterium]|nr:PorV/PorQ family protein [Candidatus Eisenbacteria bacterium]
MFRSITMILSVGLLLLASGSSMADEANGGQAGAFLRLPVGTRAAGMGSAFASVADGVEAIHLNPAGINQMEGVSLSAAYASLSMDRVHYSGGVVVANPDVGAAGLLVVRFGVDEIDGRDETGKQTSAFDDSEMMFDLAIARRLLGPVSIGAGAKFITHALADNDATGVAFDLGFHSVSVFDGAVRKWRVGASAGGLGGKLTWNTDSDHEDELPLTLRYGTSIDVGFGDVVTILSVEGRSVADGESKVLAGAEVRPHEMLALRVGFDGDYATFGGGFIVSGYEIDYAYSPDFLEEGATHRFGVTTSF